MQYNIWILLFRRVLIWFTLITRTYMQLLSEFIGTYFLIFAGCGSVAVNQLYGGAVSFPGISVSWGLIVMVMIYSVGHVSAHFNPAVTITLALLGLFPFKEVLINVYFSF